MLEVAKNYPNKFTDKFCPVCRDGKSLDSQEHIFECLNLVKENQVVDKFAEYNNLFGEDVEKMVKVAAVVKENFLRRKDILKQRTLS